MTQPTGTIWLDTLVFFTATAVAFVVILIGTEIEARKGKK